jgi:hypothetical protein
LSIRFQADADLNPNIGLGLRRREPAVDFRSESGVIPDATPDPDVLRIAADDRRVLVSRDVSTMREHFELFIGERDSPGLLLIPSNRPIGTAIEGLLMVWLNWSPDELRNLIRWLPRP